MHLPLADHAWMPTPPQVLHQFDPVARLFACLRLLGQCQKVDAPTATLDYIIIDRSEQIRADAEAS